MRKLFFWTTLAAGVTAAYLMLKRGESLSEVASRAASNPFGTLVDELTRK